MNDEIRLTHPFTESAAGMKKMLAVSFLFHGGLILLALALSLSLSPRPLSPPVYHVDLVNLPRPAPPPAVEVKENPPSPPPTEKKTPVKEVKKTKEPPRSKIELKKPSPKPPPKPVQPLAAVPPPAQSKEPSSKPSAAEEHPAQPSSPKRPEPAASIPAPEAKMQAAVELPDFKYPYYLDLIQRKIALYWFPPPLESVADLKEAVVAFVLHASGKLESIKIEKSSGNAFFDQAALRAVYQANPLPPLPQGIRDDSLKVHFSFTLMKKS